MSQMPFQLGQIYNRHSDIQTRYAVEFDICWSFHGDTRLEPGF